MTHKGLLKSFVLLISLVLATASFAEGGRTPLRVKNGIVTSASRLASQAGVDAMQAGGNAVDAAIATAFALAVTWPTAGNIGGGGFMVYHGEDGDATTFDFREKAPLAATERMFLGLDGNVVNNSNHMGALSVGVPGTVAGLWKAHQERGSLPLGAAGRARHQTCPRRHSYNLRAAKRISPQQVTLRYVPLVSAEIF